MDLMGISNYHDKNTIISDLEDDLLKVTQSLILEKEKVRKLQQELDRINGQKSKFKARLRGSRKAIELTELEVSICRLIIKAKDNGFKGVGVEKCIEIAAIVGVNYKEVYQFWNKKKLLTEISS